MNFKANKRGANDREYARLVAEESLIFDVTEEISRVLAEKGIPRTALAKELGKSKGFVTQILSGERNMTLRTVAAIGHALEHRFEVRAVPEHLKSSKATQRHGMFVVPDRTEPEGHKAFLRPELFASEGVAVGIFGSRTEGTHVKSIRVEYGPSQSSDPDHEYSLAS